MITIPPICVSWKWPQVGELILRESAAISLPSSAAVWEAGQLIYRYTDSYVSTWGDLYLFYLLKHWKKSTQKLIMDTILWSTKSSWTSNEKAKSIYCVITVYQESLTDHTVHCVALSPTQTPNDYADNDFFTSKLTINNFMDVLSFPTSIILSFLTT